MIDAIEYLEKRCPFKSVSILENKKPRPGALSRRDDGLVLPLLESKNITARLYRRIGNAPAVWDELAAEAPALLQRSFLRAIEAAPPAGMHFYYLVFYRRGRAVGIAGFQRLRFDPDRSLHLHEPSGARSWKRAIQGWVARRFRHTLLIAGNALLTGQHGNYFHETVSRDLQNELLEKAAWQLATYLRRQGQPVDAIAHKDLSETQLQHGRSWRGAGYQPLRFQPNMEMALRPEWRTFEDYLNAMTSKYRVRARRAAKKGRDLERRRLTLAETRDHTPRLYDLYRQIARQSGFNLVDLHPDFFYQLKQQLGDQYEILAYFLDGQMVGFCTLLHNGERAEAHFLGFESETNRSKQLYLNMLYDLIRLGIESQKTRIGFARTAMEIKSSVGAEPEALYVLTRAYRPLYNSVLRPVTRFLVDEPAWRQRHPFR